MLFLRRLKYCVFVGAVTVVTLMLAFVYMMPAVRWPLLPARRKTQITNVYMMRGAQDMKNRLWGSSYSTSPVEEDSDGRKQLAWYPEALSSPNWTRPVACDKCFNTDFPVLMQNKLVCKTRSDVDKIDVIMLIFTTHQAADRRQAIRDTWASVTKNNTSNVRHVFVLGRSRSEKDMHDVKEEQTVAGDLLVHDFLDSYGNLTLKTMSALCWAVKHCGRSRFFLKTDDDVWVNVAVLLDTLHREAGALQTTVGGACTFTGKPHRNASSKWHVPVRTFPQTNYPGFCSGTGYVSSLAVARNITFVSPGVPFFHLEDVYIGLCISRLGQPFTVKNLGGFFHNGAVRCGLKSRLTITSHEKSPGDLRRIWNLKCWLP